MLLTQQTPGRNALEAEHLPELAAPRPVAESLEVAVMEALDSKAKLFKAFADPIRLAIMEQLRVGERSESEIAEAVGCSGPRLAHFFACLQSFGLIQSHEQAGETLYSLCNTRILTVLDAGDDLLAGHAEEVYRCPRI